MCLAPFADKAFHIDDPLFLWAARQIQAHPIDFYGFNVNWYLVEQPMSVVTKNPPLAAYYTALVASLLGWGEVPLHLAFLVWPIARGVGNVPPGGAVVYPAAAGGPGGAADAGVARLQHEHHVRHHDAVPVGLGGGVVDARLERWGPDERLDAWLPLCASGLLVALCALTKYFGMCLIPLLLVYSLVERRRAESWLLALLIPVAILAGYQGLTHALYGQGLLADAASYATEFQELPSCLSRPSCSSDCRSWAAVSAACSSSCPCWGRGRWSWPALALRPC